MIRDYDTLTELALFAMKRNMVVFSIMFGICNLIYAILAVFFPFMGIPYLISLVFVFLAYFIYGTPKGLFADHKSVRKICKKIMIAFTISVVYIGCIGIVFSVLYLSFIQSILMLLGFIPVYVQFGFTIKLQGKMEKIFRSSNKRSPDQNVGMPNVNVPGQIYVNSNIGAQVAPAPQITYVPNYNVQVSQPGMPQYGVPMTVANPGYYYPPQADTEVRVDINSDKID